MLAGGNLGILSGAPRGRALALKDGITGHEKFQCPLAHVDSQDPSKGLPGGAQIPMSYHPTGLGSQGSHQAAPLKPEKARIV